MIAERLLTKRLQGLRKQQLTLKPHRPGDLPRPKHDGGYMLYAHVPFCELLCPYCSFNRFPYREEAARAYFASLRDEMRMVADLGYRFDAMYVGGGTPTVLVDELAATIDLARDLFDIREVSTETNPNHLNEEVLGELDGRVQRMSVGVQSLDDTLLKQMARHGKYGSAAQILERLAFARGKLPTLNVDMIFNLPSLTDEILLRDLALLEDVGADQITYYPLMVSPAVKGTLASPADLIAAVQKHRPGERIVLRVQRGMLELEFEIALGAR